MAMVEKKLQLDPMTVTCREWRWWKKNYTSQFVRGALHYTGTLAPWHIGTLIYKYTGTLARKCTSALHKY